MTDTADLPGQADSRQNRHDRQRTRCAGHAGISKAAPPVKALGPAPVRDVNPERHHLDHTRSASALRAESRQARAFT